MNVKRQRQEGSKNSIQMSGKAAVLVSLYLSCGSNVGSLPVGPVFSFPRRELHRNINLHICKFKSTAATRLLEERRGFGRFCIFRAASLRFSVAYVGWETGAERWDTGVGPGVASVRVNSPERRHIFELCRSR